MDEPADRISLTAPSELIGELDALVDDLGYASRSEAIRDALRAYITDCRWRTDTETTKQGSIVVLYNHESGVNDEILSLHHKMPDIVTSVQHVHPAATVPNEAGDRALTPQICPTGCRCRGRPRAFRTAVQERLRPAHCHRD